MNPTMNLHFLQCDVSCFSMVLQYAMFVRSSSATTAAVSLAVISAIDIVVAVTEVTSETVVSVYKNLTSLLCITLIIIADVNFVTLL